LPWYFSLLPRATPSFLSPSLQLNLSQFFLISSSDHLPKEPCKLL
jgi:hypothetical protein